MGNKAENFIGVKNKRIRIVFAPCLGHEEYIEVVNDEKEAFDKLNALALFTIFLQDSLKIMPDQPNYFSVEVEEEENGKLVWVNYYNEENPGEFYEWTDVEELFS